MLNSFDIVIPLYNKESNIINLIDLLLLNNFGYTKIIVIDDCSTDMSYKNVKKTYTNNSFVELYQMDKNSGPQKVRSKASEISNSNWLFLLMLMI